MFSTRLKVGLVTVFSCFTILLGLLGSSGIASAHTAQSASVQTTQSQTTRGFTPVPIPLPRAFGDGGIG